MSGVILDASGTIKLKVLEDALLLTQRLNALNEQFALLTKAGSPTGSLKSSIKRQLETLAANLKTHFGMISDLVTNVLISSSRGSSDVNRVRAIREGIGQIKQGIDIGMAQTRSKHQVHRAKTVAPGAGDAPGSTEA
jgi:hypothetical protein